MSARGRGYERNSPNEPPEVNPGKRSSSRLGSRDQLFSYGVVLRCAVAVALLAVALACQDGFETLLLAGLQIESMPLNFLDDVLLQDLTLESPECIFQRFTVLNVNFSQRTTSCYTGQQPNGTLS